VVVVQLSSAGAERWRDAIVDALTAATNAGCVFEINELFHLVSLVRVVFVIDAGTDQTFLRQTMQQAWRQLKERSPNRRPGGGKVSLVQMADRNRSPMSDLLRALCAAATVKPA